MPLGDWVLQAACRQVKAWDEAGFSPLRIAVNLSPQQLLKADLPEREARVLEQTSLEARRLGLELTESTLVKDMEASLTALQGLKSLGVQLAIDDFATGYSSLGYLMRFPFDQVKIDRSFVAGMEVGEGDAAIAMAIIAMAHSLDLAVIAEGVETRSQVAVLRANRCDEVQGYYVRRPLPPTKLTQLLRSGAFVPLG
jgi:EAL domain-containing protein (putative c-di-GMP-specific phosphodiesterase class I)